MPRIETPVLTPRGKRLPSAARQDGIIAAVLELSAEIGPGSVTTQAIADRIGVTQGALFRHFSDKEAIWSAVFAWLPVALGKALEDPFRDGRDPLDTLERVFFAHVDFVAAHPGVPRILFHELQRPADSEPRRRLREMVGSYRQRLVGQFQAARAAGLVAADLDAEAAAVLFIGTVQGLILQSTLFTGEGTMSAHARRLFPILRDGFRGTRRPSRAR